MKRIMTVCLAAMMLLSLIPNLQADIYQQLPSSAPIVVVTKPLNEVNQSINAFMTAVGLPSEQDMSFEAKFTEMMGLPPVIDNNGQLALCVMNPEMPDDSIVMFIPVKDQAQALQAIQQTPMFQKSTTADNLWMMDTGDGEIIYVKPAGQYFIAGSSIDTVTADIKVGLTLTPAEKAVADSHLFFCKVDLASMADDIDNMLTEAQQSFQDSPMDNPGMKIALQMVKLVKDVSSTYAGLSCGVNGVNLTAYGQAKPNTPLARMLDKHPTSDYAQLKHLENKDFVSASTFSIDPTLLAQANNYFIDLIAEMDESAQDTEKLETLKKLANDMLQYNVTQGAYVQYATPMGMPVTPVSGIVGVFQCRDAAKLIAAMRESFPIMAAMMSDTIGMDMTYLPDAGQAAGTSYDALNINMTSFYEELMGQQQMAMDMLKQQWGGDMAFNEYFMTLDNNTMVMTTSQEELALAAAKVKSSQPGLNANPMIQSVAAQLPQQANMYTFYNVAAAMQQMMRQQQNNPQMMMMMGLFSSLQGVVGYTAAVDDDVVRADAHIPVSLIQGAVNIVMQFMQGMGGGMGGPAMGPGMMPMEDDSIEYYDEEETDETP